VFRRKDKIKANTKEECHMDVSPTSCVVSCGGV